MTIPFHPLANLFPMIEGREFDDLVSDIKTNGLIEPIVILDGQVLDGRNRMTACVAAGVEYRTVSFAGADPVAFVISANLRRRHMTESARGMVAAALETMKHGGDRKSDQDANLQVDRKQAASLLNVSERTVASARTVIDHGTPELARMVRQAEISVSAAADVARLPGPEQEGIIAEGPRAIVEAAKDIRAGRYQYTGDFEWYTPAVYIDAAREVMGEIDVDPASSVLANATVKANSFYTIDDDGLMQEWRGNVWMNPPYAQPAIMHFITKLVEEVKAGNVRSAIALTNNSADTSWFHKAARVASAMCFTEGRIKFVSPTKECTSPQQGQTFFYYGDNVNLFTKVFGEFGLIVSHTAISN